MTREIKFRDWDASNFLTDTDTPILEIKDKQYEHKENKI